ncbi:MAG TPA: hypothetical protein VFB38_22495 [Chthonomonadaceae bacterium]|jgi:hypothetical protein|nr:hypothetical protein [Chthonomonadaceae bacterium]
MKPVVSFVLGLLAGMAACGVMSSAQTAPPPRRPLQAVVRPDAPPHGHPERSYAPQDVIREAVFRYQWAHYGPLWPKAKVYFLNIGTTDHPQNPGVALMKRLRREGQPVREASRLAPHAFTIRDRLTGTQGLLLTASALRWLGPREAEVEGGYLAHRRAGNRARYRVMRRGNGWVVVQETITRVYTVDTAGLQRDSRLQMLHPSGL